VDHGNGHHICRKRLLPVNPCIARQAGAFVCVSGTDQILHTCFNLAHEKVEDFLSSVFLFEYGLSKQAMN
jgi:hypothetical protein